MPNTSLDTLSSEERIAFVLDVRRRIQAHAEVSDEEIRDAVRLIRLSRADFKAKPNKAPVKVVSLSDF